MTRHKARLKAEFVKVRLRRGCSSIGELRARFSTADDPKDVTSSNDYRQSSHFHPRWVRINSLRTNLEEQLRTTFADYKQVESLEALGTLPITTSLFADQHIPNLLALPASADLTKSPAYLDGKIILQDKASCFPAYLLDLTTDDGDVVDACAAPGNKATHLAALLREHDNGQSVTIHACERDSVRANALARMVSTAGAEHVKVYAGQDFLNTDIQKPPWNRVRCLLLDPSCSGSGILGRDEPLNLTLPQRRAKDDSTNIKKRKRGLTNGSFSSMCDAGEETILIEKSSDELRLRLQALSAFQLKLLVHALSFFDARKVVYSTCSIYAEENEQVVIKGLLSDIAEERGWRILRRAEQVDGLRRWSLRGNYEACASCIGPSDQLDATEVADACIRCEKGSKEGTQGFFVAGFVKDCSSDRAMTEDEWEGFSEPD